MSYLFEVHRRLDALVVVLDALPVHRFLEWPALLQGLDLLFQEVLEHVSEGHLEEEDVKIKIGEMLRQHEGEV